MDIQRAIDGLSRGEFEFIDLGCGTGGSTDHCIRRFGAKSSLGLELDAKDVAGARQAGYPVVEADVVATTVPDRCVRFVSAMDFLEHLPGDAISFDVLERFARAARDFAFIRHPSFEESEYLESVGLRLAWTDWTGHPAMMRIEDFERFFERMGWTEYAIVPRLLIADSSFDQIIPITAPRDTVTYDEAVHGPKPFVRFDRPIYTQFDIFVRLNPEMTDDAWRAIVFSDLYESSPQWPIRIVSSRKPPAGPLATDLGGYDPSTSIWRLRDRDGSERTAKYGAEGRGWLPLVGDFDGDGHEGIGAYDPADASFFLRNSQDAGLADVTLSFSSPGGQPTTGDWTGSGISTICVYHSDASRWKVRHSNGPGPADEEFQFGSPQENRLAIAGDWNGSGRDKVGLYDPADGAWYLRGEGSFDSEDTSFVFGPPGGLPVVGDWDGDGIDSIGVYVPEWGLWILRDTNTNGPADRIVAYRIDNSRPLCGNFSDTHRS